MEHVAKFGWTVLPLPPYNPDSASSDFHLFGPMKGGLAGDVFQTTTPSSQLQESWSPPQVNIFRSAACRLLFIDGENAWPVVVTTWNDSGLYLKASSIQRLYCVPFICCNFCENEWEALLLLALCYINHAENSLRYVQL
jgi:hypothetical protein